MTGVAEPEKELRFTRSAQAAGFWVAGAVFSMAVITLVAVAFKRHENTALPHPAWALFPLCFAVAAIRLAIHLNRHAYLILTPLGIDIFPFFRPARNMRTVFWQEIKAVESDPGGGMLTLHFDEARTSGIHLSLRPMARPQRSLLLHALGVRLGGRASSGGQAPSSFVSASSQTTEPRVP